MLLDQINKKLALLQADTVPTAVKPAPVKAVVPRSVAPKVKSKTLDVAVTSAAVAHSYEEVVKDLPPSVIAEIEEEPLIREVIELADATDQINEEVRALIDEVLPMALKKEPVMAAPFPTKLEIPEPRRPKPKPKAKEEKKPLESVNDKGYKTVGVGVPNDLHAEMTEFVQKHKADPDFPKSLKEFTLRCVQHGFERILELEKKKSSPV